MSNPPRPKPGAVPAAMNAGIRPTQTMSPSLPVAPGSQTHMQAGQVAQSHPSQQPANGGAPGAPQNHGQQNGQQQPQIQTDGTPLGNLNAFLLQPPTWATPQMLMLAHQNALRIAHAVGR